MNITTSPESYKSSSATTPSTSPELQGQNESNHHEEGGKLSVKFCRVCGDKALGYNFNVVTCESCKAFFRRNALKSKEFRCPFSNSCNVSVVSRRFCQKCRLRKCFEVGMKKEWIMSDEAKCQKKQRIQENRQKRKGSSSFNDETGSVKRIGSSDLYDSLSRESSEYGSHSVGHKEQRLSVTSPQSYFQQEHYNSRSQIQTTPIPDDCITIPKSMLINLLSSNTSSSSTSTQQKPLSVNHQNWGWVPPPRQCTCQCTCGAKPPGNVIGVAKVDKAVITDPEIYFDPMLIQSTQIQQIQFGNLPTDIFPYACDRPSQSSYINVEDSVYKVLNAAITSEFSDDVNLSLDSSVDQQQQQGYLGLNEFEQHKLEELVAANEVMNEPMEKLLGDKKKENPSLTDVINMTDIAIRRIIKMSKRIECFKNLCQEDQIALLKGGCTELMILRGVMSYDPEKESWHGPRSHYIKLEVLKGIKGNVYEEHKRYLQSFNSVWRTNEPLMLILCAITLFTPDRPNVTHKEIIKNEQEMYYSMLKRVLEYNYGGCEAKKSFVQLAENIEKLHRLNDNAIRIFLDVNPKDVEPLLIEIFDLK